MRPIFRYVSSVMTELFAQCIGSTNTGPELNICSSRFEGENLNNFTCFGGRKKVKYSAIFQSECLHAFVSISLRWSHLEHYQALRVLSPSVLSFYVSYLISGGHVHVSIKNMTTSFGLMRWLGKVCPTMSMPTTTCGWFCRRVVY